MLEGYDNTKINALGKIFFQNTERILTNQFLQLEQAKFFLNMNEDDFLEWCKENNLIHKIIGYSEDQYEL